MVGRRDVIGGKEGPISEFMAANRGVLASRLAQSIKAISNEGVGTPMPNIVRRSPQTIQPDHFLNAQVAEAERVGITAVARIQSGAFAASVAMQNMTMLSRSADAAFRTSPMGEDSYRAILAAYGTLAVAEIQALGMRGRS
jgi:hypothetical protein